MGDCMCVYIYVYLYLLCVKWTWKINILSYFILSLEDVSSSEQSFFDGRLPRLSTVAIEAGPDGMRVLNRHL